MSEILKKIGTKSKNAAKEVFYFLTSGVFLKNFLGVLTFTGLVLLLTSTWMHCYTNHGESLQVHDYVGMQLEDVIKKAEDRSFEIFITDSIFLVGKPPHTILEQSPVALSRVKKNRKIYLTVTKSTPDEVLLPALDGGNDDYNQYSKKMKRLSMSSKIVGRRFSNKLEENTILEVIHAGDTITSELSTGYKIPMGSLVEFIVTSKGGGRVEIPNLVCKKYDAAKFLVGNYNLNIGSIVKDATVSNQYSAYVWKQIPRYSPSGSIRIGEQIDIYLTQYKPDNCTGNAPPPRTDRVEEQKTEAVETGADGGEPEAENKTLEELMNELSQDPVNIEAPPAQPGGNSEEENEDF